MCLFHDVLAILRLNFENILGLTIRSPKLLESTSYTPRHNPLPHRREQSGIDTASEADKVHGLEGERSEWLQLLLIQYVGGVSPLKVLFVGGRVRALAFCDRGSVVPSVKKRTHPHLPPAFPAHAARHF
jgi:hypothetical protein